VKETTEVVLCPYSVRNNGWGAAKLRGCRQNDYVFRRRTCNGNTV